MLPLPHLTNLPKLSPRSFTVGTLPSFIDSAQPPVKRQPFAAIRTQKAVSSLSLVLPKELAVLVEQELASRERKYAKVIMKLENLLEGDLWTEGVKKGDIMMMSEGRRGVDIRYEFFDGILRIELDKATYERAGLQGKPIADGGQKHRYTRYAITLNLRAASMLHGKKGFSRILWTCKNVLNQSLTWVFADVNSSNAEAVSAALETHRPRWFVSRPASTTMSDVVVPEFSVHDEKGAADLAYAQELEEWLGLVVMRSERVTMGDRPNPFSCRYEVPSMDGMTGDEEVRQVVNLRVVRWHGFMPSRFALDMMVWLRRAAKGQHWFALQTKGLTRDQDGLTLSHMGARGLEEAEYMCWHVPS